MEVDRLLLERRAEERQVALADRPPHALGAFGQERQARLEEGRSILDAVTQQIKDLQRSLGQKDKVSVDDYFILSNLCARIDELKAAKPA